MFRIALKYLLVIPFLFTVVLLYSQGEEIYSSEKYGTIDIYGEYKFIYEKNSRHTFGVLKQSELILPIIFSCMTNDNTGDKRIVFGLGDTYGLYNIETEKWDIPIKYASLGSLSKELFVASTL